MALENKLGSTYFKIGLMFLAWGFMIALRAIIVIPDEPAPIVYEYHRPEKKIEMKVEQRDTIYMLTGDWFFPYNFQLYNYPFNGCGGVIYMDQWGYPGYGFPSWGGYPLGFPIVLNSGVDSVQVDSTDFQNVDSVEVTSAGPLTNLNEIEESMEVPKTIKQFFQKRSAERLDRRKQRIEKRMLRRAINR